MTAKLSSSYLKGEVLAITSKSYAHRAMICEFILGKEIDLSNYDLSSDILATYNCLKAIKNGEKTLDANESGSTLRFIIPLLLALGYECDIKMHGKLKDRPNDDLLFSVSGHGATFKTIDDKIYTYGKLVPGIYEIRADKSSQYLSGLIMALSIFNEPSVIKLLTPISSRPYVDVTIEVLKSFGFNVIEKDDEFIVGGDFKNQLNPIIEGDWSNSAFFLVAGAINGDVTVKGLNLNSVQADKKILEVLKTAGVSVNLTDNAVTVQKSKIKPFNFDAENCPDLVPIVSVLGAYADGVSKITGVKRLRLKESDRIVSTAETLNSCGIKVETFDDQIIIHGGVVKGGTIDGFNDHRIVMAGAILSLLSKGQVTILGAEAVKKSYPKFFEDFNSLGGKVNVEI